MVSKHFKPHRYNMLCSWKKCVLIPTRRQTYLEVVLLDKCIFNFISFIYCILNSLKQNNLYKFWIKFDPSRSNKHNLNVKISDSIWPSLLMWNNTKCNNSHISRHRLSKRKVFRITDLIQEYKTIIDINYGAFCSTDQFKYK